MKIGILTWHKVNNYGTFWLCYAMQRYIENLGHEAVLLDYCREIYIKNGNEDTPLLKTQMNIFQKMRNITPNRVNNERAYAKKLQLFFDFRKEYLHIGRLCTEADDCDAIIIGSDQIFDCKYEFNSFQYGIGIPCGNISAYAPSFGEMTVELMDNKEHKFEIAEALKALSVLTVRDENSMRIVEKLIGVSPEVAIDPVLLYGFKEEQRKWKQRLVKASYLIIYTWGGSTAVNEELKKQAVKLAKRNCLKTVSVGERRPWCDIDYASATPLEFFKLFLDADLVLTNMFHGTCFSILFNRPFYSISMPHNKNKLEDLLYRFNLEQQLLSDLQRIEEMNIPKINYEEANNKVEIARKISIELFNKMLVKN